MNVAASGRTWEDASSPAAIRLTRSYEEAWQQASRGGRRLEPGEVVKLHMELEPGTPAVTVDRAEVVWSRKDTAGLRFVDLSPTARAASRASSPTATPLRGTRTFARTTPARATCGMPRAPSLATTRTA